MRSSGRLALACCASLCLVGCLTWNPEAGGLEWNGPAIRPAGTPVWLLLRERLARHDPEAVRTFWVQMLEGLHGDDVGHLAEMADTVDFVAEHHAWIPGVREYADWLRGRRLYFEAAQHAVAEERRLKREQQAMRARDRAVRRPSARPPHPAPLVLPRAPTAFSRTPPLPTLPPGRSKGAKRETVETGRAYWRGKLADEPRPAASGSLVPALETAFRAEGIPEEWIWIAEVESSMNPKAKSPAGAAGLFQLMPRTATSLGLALRPEDQRLDPALNARAAARYLRALHKRFGCWSLTLAAYNAGQGRVASLCRAHGSTFDAIAPRLPLETRLYVPRVFETVRARTGVDPETLPAPTGA
jgi:membrane-bound lytic murein transglycosylase D